MAMPLLGLGLGLGLGSGVGLGLEAEGQRGHEQAGHALGGYTATRGGIYSYLRQREHEQAGLAQLDEAGHLGDIGRYMEI